VRTIRSPFFLVHETHEIDYMPPRQIAREFVKTFRTAVVGRPRRLTEQIVSSKPSTNVNGIIEITPREFPRRWGLSVITDPINSRLWKQAVRPEIGQSPPVVLFDRPVQHHRVGILSEIASGYYAHCDYTIDILGRADPAAEADELKILRKVDVAFAASPLLVERFSRYAKRVVHLPCGYSSDLFDGERTYAVPEALSGIPRPRILFCGYISGRIDFLGLLETVRSRPDWNFVFLGAVSAALPDELTASGRPADLFAQMQECRNFHYVGRVALDMVAPFMAACDVGLVPYCLSDFTMTSSPQKNFEYLAMGKPVVATAIPETTCVSDDIVLATESESYEKAIELALAKASDLALVEKRKVAAKQNSMAVRAQTVIDALLKCENQQKSYRPDFPA
jgi:glycosyltransferase involved in cell wall biosynthesis